MAANVRVVVEQRINQVRCDCVRVTSARGSVIDVTRLRRLQGPVALAPDAGQRIRRFTWHYQAALIDGCRQKPRQLPSTDTRLLLYCQTRRCSGRHTEWEDSVP